MPTTAYNPAILPPEPSALVGAMHALLLADADVLSIASTDADGAAMIYAHEAPLAPDGIWLRYLLRLPIFTYAFASLASSVGHYVWQPVELVCECSGRLSRADAEDALAAAHTAAYRALVGQQPTTGAVVGRLALALPIERPETPGAARYDGDQDLLASVARYRALIAPAGAV